MTDTTSRKPSAPIWVYVFMACFMLFAASEAFFDKRIFNALTYLSFVGVFLVDIFQLKKNNQLPKYYKHALLTLGIIFFAISVIRRFHAA